MNLIENIKYFAINCGNRIALINPNSCPQKITYRELYCKAWHLAEYISLELESDNPIIVYGHKNPYMIISFLACVMSGHAYCPIDISMPMERVNMVIKQTQNKLLIATEEFYTDKTKILELSEITKICSCNLNNIPEIPSICIQGNQTFYIIFTSGSTGIPKGVEITSNALNNFLSWSVTLGEEDIYDKNNIFLNQAPFSFDLSVMDLYTSLSCGATLCMMNKKIQSDVAKTVEFIIKYNITSFVSTPSFVNMCMLDKRFNANKVPSLRNFFFCGEILTNKTASKLLQRFPGAVIQNAYGPTESTVAVSSVRITNEILKKYEILPVGTAKPGTEFLIAKNKVFEKDGHEIGEILIIGNTLARGYFGQDDLTEKSFIKIKHNGEIVTAYKTGDLGYIKQGQLFYEGRIDLQIKLNGYRIEIGDIENNILKESYVDSCAVIPRWSEGKVKGLTAVVVLNDRTSNTDIARKKIIDHLSGILPEYMIPKSYCFLNAMPMTNNGKIDRKSLDKIVEEG